MPVQKTKAIDSRIDPDSTLSIKSKTFKTIFNADLNVRPISEAADPNYMTGALEQLAFIYFGSKPASQKIKELKACLEVATAYVNKLKAAHRARLKLL